MAGGKTPGVAGTAPVNVRDGTLALAESPQPGPLTVRAHAYHRRVRRRRLSFHLTHDGDGSASAEGLAWRYSTDPDVGWLYDFGIGSTELRSAHKRYLEQSARRLLSRRDKTWNVGIQGLASRSGSESLNHRLSEQRAAAAFEYLKARAPGVKIIPYGVGEGFATDMGEKEGKENMFFRAAIVSVWATEKDPPPPPPAPKETKETKEFRLRITSGRSGGPSLFHVFTAGSDAIRFEILDVEANLVCRYDFSDKFVGVGVPIPIPFSFVEYTRGKWRSFMAPRSWSLENISGNASFYGVGDTLEGPLSGGRTDFTFSYPTPQHHHWYWNTDYHQTVTDVDVVAWGLPSAGANYGGGRVLGGTLRPLGKPFPYDGR